MLNHHSILVLYSILNKQSNNTYQLHNGTNWDTLLFDTFNDSTKKYKFEVQTTPKKTSSQINRTIPFNFYYNKAPSRNLIPEIDSNIMKKQLLDFKRHILKKYLGKIEDEVLKENLNIIFS